MAAWVQSAGACSLYLTHCIKSGCISRPSSQLGDGPARVLFIRAVWLVLHSGQAVVHSAIQRRNSMPGEGLPASHHRCGRQGAATGWLASDPAVYSTQLRLAAWPVPHPCTCMTCTPPHERGNKHHGPATRHCVRSESVPKSNARVACAGLRIWPPCTLSARAGLRQQPGRTWARPCGSWQASPGTQWVPQGKFCGQWSSSR